MDEFLVKIMCLNQGKHRALRRMFGGLSSGELRMSIQAARIFNWTIRVREGIAWSLNWP